MHLHFAFFTGKNILYNIFTYVATKPPAGNDKCDDIKNRNNNEKKQEWQIVCQNYYWYYLLVVYSC